MNKEIFEEWFKETEERAIEEMGKLPELHDNFVLKNMCETVWNHQQNKIEYLEAKLERAATLIRLSQTRLSTTPCENGKTLGENYVDFLKTIRETSKEFK